MKCISFDAFFKNTYSAKFPNTFIFEPKSQTFVIPKQITINFPHEDIEQKIIKNQNGIEDHDLTKEISLTFDHTALYQKSLPKPLSHLFEGKAPFKINAFVVIKPIAGKKGSTYFFGFQLDST